MNGDFHYYATYCSAFLAGYDHKDCMDICYSSVLVDWCSRTFLSKIKAPFAAATTQLQLELMDFRTDTAGIQDITRIWSSFHFLPYDLNAEKPHCSKKYLDRFRLICNVNGPLVADTVELAKNESLQAVGLAMHVLADTWAHRYFAGTPSLVINDTGYYFFELVPDGTDGSLIERPVHFIHSMGADDPEKGIYTNTISHGSEKSIMCLGHGRAGHLPDYSYVKYKYMPAWGDYMEIIKNNPEDFYNAFCQMIYALKYLRGENEEFKTATYDYESAKPYREKIEGIFSKRQIDDTKDWKELAESISGENIEDFSLERYQDEYISADEEKKDDTFLGRFFLAAMAQKSMVTNKIYKSGNKLAGYSVNYSEKGFKGIRDFRKLVEHTKKEGEL